MGGVHFIPDRDSEGHVIQRMEPFGSKTVNGKKLYKRVHGLKQDVVVGNNYFNFTVPYAACKITGAEFINAPVGCTANFFILDTATGTVTTIPDYPLNQFGFDVNISKDRYDHKSEFDADLFTGLQINIVLNSPVAVTDLGVNFILNELKD